MADLMNFISGLPKVDVVFIASLSPHNDSFTLRLHLLAFRGLRTFGSKLSAMLKELRVHLSHNKYANWKHNAKRFFFAGERGKAGEDTGASSSVKQQC